MHLLSLPLVAEAYNGQCAASPGTPPKKRKSNRSPGGNPLYISSAVWLHLYTEDSYLSMEPLVLPQSGVSESIIGLTLVAGGTSLPELAASIVAALKKNPGIAIGQCNRNNLFNIFFIIGMRITEVSPPLYLSGITNFDLFTLVNFRYPAPGFFGLFFAKRTITRIEGSIMVVFAI